MSAPRVVLTRADEDNAALAARLRERGAEVISYPCIAVAPVTPAADVVARLAGVAPFGALAFPSRRAVSALVDQAAVVDALGLRAAELLVGCVGARTAAQARDAGWNVAVVADPPRGATLGQALAAQLTPAAPVLIACGDRTRPELPEALQAAGHPAHQLVVYAHQPVHPPPLPPPAPDAVHCASPSAAETFLRANPGLKATPFAAIGPTTAAALRALGVTTVHPSLDFLWENP